jgi:uncharacterized protein (DUF305 family)
MKIPRLAQVAAIPAALLVLIAGCASLNAATPAAPGTAAAHNDADTTFAQMMVIHHEGAIEMAALAETEAETPEVRDLATRIKAAQGPEIDRMRGWLKEWGEPAPEDADMGGMGHDGMDMGGLDQEAAMDELDQLDGTALDRRFLTLMIQHHQGALTMAEQQVANGSNGDAIALAKTIISAQQKEIAEMESLLDQLP